MDIMDNTLLRLSDFLSSSRRPPVIYAALHRLRAHNTPRALIGINFQESGSFESYTIGDMEIKLPVNYAGVVNCHHGADSRNPSSDFRMWVVAVDVSDTNEFDDIAEQQFFVKKPVRNPAAVISAYNKTASRYPYTGDVSALNFKASCLELLSVIMSETSSTQEELTPLPDMVKDALTYIHRRFYNHEIDLEKIASSAHTSKRHIDRMFKQHLNITPMKYLRKRRIEYAKSLLIQGNLRISEIAEASGYPDQLHFSRVFKNEVGVSPSEYRDVNHG
ncbi:MAG: helix-turn-helix transcriptional regulator [Planctomycetota bacterium]|jgi:AraC-like DNA-binding protein